MKELLIALRNVLDNAVLSLHLASVLHQAEAQVSARRCDPLKQGAHVLGVDERPTCLVGQKLGVTNSGHALTPHHITLIPYKEQGDGGVIEDRQVVLTELWEGLAGSPLQSVIEVVAPSCG
jgi:hypothetical protein